MLLWMCHGSFPPSAPLQLDKMYPNMLMKLRLSAPSAPFLSITPGGISLQPVADIQAYAILPNTSLAPLFLLSLVSWDWGCVGMPFKITNASFHTGCTRVSAFWLV